MGQLSKFLCGKCFEGYEGLQAFGDHLCLGDNPVLARLRGVIRMGGFSLDLRKVVQETIRRHKVRAAIDTLEDGLRRTDP
ncbi:MAG: hypothetical protein JOZ91_11290 [Candidatus Eremiobacteraeota bacterium]|nr:hypothetical protein [Candidatus Eremiobacteraeota bacterium]